MPRLNMVQAINLALKEEMRRDNGVVVLGEDVGRDGGVFRVTEGLIDEFGPGRVIDTPPFGIRDRGRGHRHGSIRIKAGG